MPGLASLVLADARFPGGGHVHSGGLEEAVSRGLVSDVASLEGFLRGRLRTAGLVAAAFAAASAAVSACRPSSGPSPSRPSSSCDGAAATRARFAELDAELEARTPSAAAREASRAQGRGTLRAVRAAWPSPVLDDLAAVHPRPHHPLLIGAACGVAGEPPGEAARCVAYLAVSGPASAAVRLLGLDPFAVNAVLVGLGPALETVVAEAVSAADGPPPDLPAPGAPVLDLMAQAHVDQHRGRLRLFAS
ncbi:urease accessory protein UreF [Pseudonocardia kujensis]|uniref:urease accessory protein UreF n=1 Tax=Pseudonocardia kujensis TaxID=1128675 RepID=UPI001E63CD23|nr:urease accessory UreF family protein [Pseudonocardia kujensis]MCE0764531.1 urease accessory protein UreF [Pseudonocardia kujensis]